MAGGIAPVDFWGVFNAAAESSRQRRLDAQREAQAGHQLKMQQQQLDAQTQERADALAVTKQKAEADAQRRQALADMMSGADPQGAALTQMDPEAALAARKQMGEVEQQRATALANQQKAADTRAKNTAAFKLEAVRQIARNPASAPAVQAAIQRLAQAGQIDEFQLPGHALPEGMAGPQMAPTMGEAATLQGAALAEGAQPQGRDAQLVSEGFVLGSPMAERRARAVGDKSGTTVNVGTGAAGIEKPTKAKFEQDINTTDGLLNEIAGINKSIDGELVGFKGAAGERLGSVIDYFGTPGKQVATALGMDANKALDFLEKRQALKTKVRDLGDRVLRVRSGANAPEPEVKKLESIVGSIDSMGERQLRAALATFAESLQAQRDSKAQAIAGGTNVKPPKGGKAPQMSNEDRLRAEAAAGDPEAIEILGGGGQ